MENNENTTPGRNLDVRPAITVAVPARNAAAFIGECVESVLAQTFTDFELLVVDDGSTDNTCACVESFRDPRIRLLRRSHDFIATKNTLLDEARGRYIAFLDADDRALPDRLQTEWDFMEARPDVDAVGSGVWMFGEMSRTALPAVVGRPITLADMLRANQLFNSTVMLRKSRLDAYDVRFPEDYLYANDYALWMEMLLRGMRIENLESVLTEYRVSPDQITRKHRAEQTACAERIKADALRRQKLNFQEKPTDFATFRMPASDNRLTLIIPFLNEGEEVRNTVASVRETVGHSVDILVINDASYDGYDYQSDLASYDVVYVRSAERRGVAASRDLGVSLCSTPYFLLLDAHMRFYDKEWADKIVCHLDADDRCVLCCQTRILHKENGRVFEPRGRRIRYYGAYLPFNKESFLPDIEWNDRDFFPDRTVAPIAAVLGAGYAASRRYWQRLRGLQGLLHYGSDEAYLSLKVWMEGGRCLLLKDVEIGHIYRSAAPYANVNEKVLYNHLMIATLLLPPTLRGLAYAVAHRKNPAAFAKAVNLLLSRRAELGELKQYYRSVLTVPFTQVLAWNYILPAEKEQRIRQRDVAYLPRIAAWLKGNLPTDDYGLWNGRAGLMVWFCIYARFSRNEVWDEAASMLWSDICERVLQGRFPLNFRYGLCGIGWAALFLKGHRLLEDDIDDILSAIDAAVQAQDFAAWENLSLPTGIAGVLLYATLRLRFAGQTGQSAPYSDRKLGELDACAERIVADLGSETAALSAAFRYRILRREGPGAPDLAPSFSDWMNYPGYLVEDERFWTPSLVDGVAGYGLLVMSVISHLKKSPYYGSNE